jgi:ATP-dependent DNA helicase RecG
LNEDFARILIKNPTLSLEDTLILDKVQKQKIISEEEFKYLKKQQFIEGRKPNVFLSSQVIEPTEDEGLKATYIRNKGFDDEYSKKLILQYIFKWKEASRKQIETLLFDKLSDVLDEKSKKNKIMHFLQALRKENKIEINEFRKWRLK